MRPENPSIDREDLAHVLAKCELIWSELEGARIFIAGGTGFIGRWLLESLFFASDQLALRLSIVILTRDPQQFRLNAPDLWARLDLEVIEGDVTSFAFPAGPFSHVIHAATTSRVWLDNDVLMSTILGSTARMLEFIEREKVGKFLFVSSGAVYGNQPENVLGIDEEFIGAPDPLQPSSAYGEAKRCAECLCALAAQKIDTQIKIARCFAFIGPFLALDTHFAVGNFIGDALNGRTIVVKGGGQVYRSYMYAADLIVWLLTILCSGKHLRAYNVGSDQPYRIIEVAEAVKRLASRPVTIEIQTGHAHAASRRAYVPSVERAKTELGLDVHFDLDASISRTIAWNQQRHARGVK